MAFAGKSDGLARKDPWLSTNEKAKTDRILCTVDRSVWKFQYFSFENGDSIFGIQH